MGINEWAKIQGTKSEKVKSEDIVKLEYWIWREALLVMMNGQPSYPKQYL